MRSELSIRKRTNRSSQYTLNCYRLWLCWFRRIWTLRNWWWNHCIIQRRVHRNDIIIVRNGFCSIHIVLTIFLVIFHKAKVLHWKPVLWIFCQHVSFLKVRNVNLTCFRKGLPSDVEIFVLVFIIATHLFLKLDLPYSVCISRTWPLAQTSGRYC